MQLYLQPIQDLTVDDRVTRTQYQYTLEDPDLSELNEWTSKLVTAIRKLPEVSNVATDQQVNGVSANLEYDRATASRFNINADQVDSTLYDAFGQRQVDTLYTQSNQYHVILEVLPQFQTGPTRLNDIYIQGSTGTSTNAQSVSGRTGAITTGSQATLTPSSGSAFSSTPTSALASSSGTGSTLATTSTSSAVTSTTQSLASTTPTPTLASAASAATGSSSTTTGSSGGASSSSSSSTTQPTPVPLSAISHFVMRSSPLTVSHQGQFPVVTVSFNVADGFSLGQAVDAIKKAQRETGMPASVQADFQGTAAAYDSIGSNLVLLILAALVAVYIVLGTLYESFIHPLTILSTLMVPEDVTLVVYCRSTNDFVSARVAAALRRRGVTRIRVLEGGLNAWKASGQPLSPTLGDPLSEMKRLGIEISPQSTDQELLSSEVA